MPYSLRATRGLPPLSAAVMFCSGRAKSMNPSIHLLGSRAVLGCECPLLCGSSETLQRSQSCWRTARRVLACSWPWVESGEGAMMESKCVELCLSLLDITAGIRLNTSRALKNTTRDNGRGSDSCPARVARTRPPMFHVSLPWIDRFCCFKV